MWTDRERMVGNSEKGWSGFLLWSPDNDTIRNAKRPKFAEEIEGPESRASWAAYGAVDS
jgi:hypothetical protein